MELTFYMENHKLNHRNYRKVNKLKILFVVNSKRFSLNNCFFQDIKLPQEL